MFDYVAQSKVTCIFVRQKQIDMKSFKITYQRKNGTIDFEVVSAKSEKLTKQINNYFFHIGAEILKVETI